MLDSFDSYSLERQIFRPYLFGTGFIYVYHGNIFELCVLCGRILWGLLSAHRVRRLRRACTTKTPTLLPCAHGARTELDLLCDDFGRLPRLAVLALPAAGLDAPFDEQQAALHKKLRNNLRLPAPNHDVMEFCFILLCASLIGPDAVRGDADRHNRHPARRGAELGVGGKATKNKDFI